MPLLKVKSAEQKAVVNLDEAVEAINNKPANPEKHIFRHSKAEMTKDDYWRRREERDIERDKHMAWSGLAQAALGSVLVAQLNTDNTEDGLVKLVARLVDKLLKERDSR